MWRLIDVRTSARIPRIHWKVGDIAHLSNASALMAKWKTGIGKSPEAHEPTGLANTQ